MSYGILFDYGNFLDDTYEQVIKYFHGLMDDFIYWRKPYLLLSANWWNIVMDDWVLDEKLLGKWQQLQHCNSIIPPKNMEWQIMTRECRFIILVAVNWVPASADIIILEGGT